MNRNVLLTVLVFLLLLAIPKVWFTWAVSANPNVIKVPQDYPVIQWAINAANPGDTIIVSSGTYNELINVNKSITLSGKNAIIDGLTHGTVITVAANDVKISGFIIQNTGGQYGPGFTNHGIEVKGERCTIKNNIIRINWFGIKLASKDSTVYENRIEENWGVGIYIDFFGANNYVYGNNLDKNDFGGIDVWGAQNIIYHNNFDNYGQQAQDHGWENKWDNGAEGNYWSNYVGKDFNGDGIGDTLLPHLGIDKYPLIEPWSEVRTITAYIWNGVTYRVTMRSNNTVASFNFDHSTKQIKFNVTGPSGNVGFANVTIPKLLLEGSPWQVTIDGNETSNFLKTETTDATSLYFNYNLTTHRVRITGTQTLDIIPPLATTEPNQTVNEDTVVTLDGSGSYDNVGIVNYTWTFVDVTPKTLTGIKPTYIFNTPGKYTVTLNVTDAIRNWNTSTVIITVLDITPPIANAGQNQTILQGTTLTFNGGKSSDNVGIILYNWEFGDETSQTGVVATHTYSNPGTYIVTLTVKDAAGNTNTDKITINVTSYVEAYKLWIVVFSVAIMATIMGLFAWRRRKRG